MTQHHEGGKAAQQQPSPDAPRLRHARQAMANALHILTHNVGYALTLADIENLRKLHSALVDADVMLAPLGENSGSEVPQANVVTPPDQLPQTALAPGNPDNNENAPWLTLAHVVCSDAGIGPGHIMARLELLRDSIQLAEAEAGDATFAAALKHTWQMANPYTKAQPGSYELGRQQGIQDALTTIKSNYTLEVARRASRPALLQQPQETLG